MVVCCYVSNDGRKACMIILIRHGKPVCKMVHKQEKVGISGSCDVIVDKVHTVMYIYGV